MEKSASRDSLVPDQIDIEARQAAQQFTRRPRAAVGPEAALGDLCSNQCRRGSTKRTNPSNMSGNSIQTAWNTLHGSRRLVPVRNDRSASVHNQAAAHTYGQPDGVVPHCDASERGDGVDTKTCFILRFFLPHNAGRKLRGALVRGVRKHDP